MSFKKSFLKSAFTIGGFNYLTQGVNFFSTMILARLIDPEEYGYVWQITIFTGFVMLFADAGLGAEVIRSPYKSTYYKAVSNLCFFTGVALTILLMLLAVPIAWFYEDFSLVLPTILLSLIFIFRTLAIVPSAILTKELAFKQLGIIRFFTNLSSVIITIIMALMGCAFWSLIVPMITVELLNYIWYVKTTKFYPKIYPKAYTVVAFRRNVKLLGNQLGFHLINYWARHIDNMLVGKYYSDADLGIYGRGYKFLELALTLMHGVFGTVLLPSLNKVIEEGKDIRKEYFFILGLINTLSYPIALLLIAIPDWLVFFLWGEKWMAVAQFLPYFGVLILMQTMNSTMGNMYLLFKKENLLFRLGLVSNAVLISAIAFGAYNSMLDIARYYSLSFILFVIPLNLYYGYMKVFGYSFFDVFRFWAPKLFFALLIIATAWLEVEYSSLFNGYSGVFSLLSFPLLRIAFVLFYLAHLLLSQRHEISKAKALLTKKIKKN